VVRMQPQRQSKRRNLLRTSGPRSTRISGRRGHIHGDLYPVDAMEAANESGRHAAAALIYKCLPRPAAGDRGAAQGSGLVGDFPQFFKIEECKADGLNFPSTSIESCSVTTYRTFWIFFGYGIR
jgi:hypothetical protein